MEATTAKFKTQTGDRRVWLGLSTTPTVLGWVIRCVTGQRASHAWVSYYDATLYRRMVLEATAGGFVVKTWDKWRKENKRARIWCFAAANGALPLADGIVYLAKFLDTPYDFKGMLWFLVRHFVRKPWLSPKKWKCSEAHVRMLRHIGAEGSDFLDAEATTPGDLLAYYERSNQFMRVEMEERLL